MLAPNPQAPTEATPKWHDVTIVRKRKYECAKVEPVAPEEFGIARNARSIRDAGYLFHEMPRAEAELIEEGYDEDQIRDLPTYVDTGGTEQAARDTVDETAEGGDALNRANRLVKITEHYIRMDYEGNGKCKMYRVCTGGDDSTVLYHNGELAVVEEEYPCFAAMTPVIVTHRFYGKSVADLVMDIQKIKTALTRGLLDHLYRANNPRPVVAEAGATENTLDDLLLSRHGHPIRVKTDAAATVVWQTIPDISGAIYPALQYFDATREWRTGVARQGQGVDPNALQNQVATIANQMFNTAQAKMKLIARIFAETGIRDLFSLLHATIRKHGSQSQTVRLRNKWVAVDPRSWKSRDDMTINVGLGTGGKTEQVTHLTTLAQFQKALLEGGKSNIVSDDNLYNTAKQLTKLIGIKNPNEHFTDPKTVPPPPPPGPDPTKMAELQAKASIEKLQAEADIATNNKKVEADIFLNNQKFQHTAALEERRFELERELKLLDAQLGTQKHQQSMEQSKEQHQHKLRERSETGNGATLQVRHAADEVTGPISDALGAIGEKLTSSQQEHQASVMKALEQMQKNMSAPKRIVRDKSGKVSHVETMLQ